MKIIIAIFRRSAIPLVVLAVLMTACWVNSDITGPYDPPFYAGFEERPEANGYVVTYGDSAYGTSIGLTSDSYDGDSAFVAFILRANCTDNEIPGTDSCYVKKNPHRGYVEFQSRAYRIGTTLIQGRMIDPPVWMQARVKIQNLTLVSHGPGKIDDWTNILTISPDSTNNGDSVVTVNMDTHGYLNLFHVPVVGQGIRLFQADSINDPGRDKVFTQNVYHLVQVFFDPKYTHRVAVWMDGKLESLAQVTGREVGVAQFHWVCYTAPAVGHGTFKLDEVRTYHVKDSLEGVFKYMSLPPSKGG